MTVPYLRQDLKLSEGPKKEDGSSSWLLYDSLRNKYFSINKNAFDLLNNWSSGSQLDDFIKKINEINLLVSEEEINEFINFLDQNNLTIKKTSEEVKSLVVQKNKTNKHWLLKLIHNYLFFKIPLVRPGNLAPEKFTHCLVLELINSQTDYLWFRNNWNISDNN